MMVRPWLRGLGFLGLVAAVLVVLTQGRVSRGVTLEGIPVGGLKREKVEALVLELAEERKVLPQNAHLDLETGEIIPDKPGLEVDVEATLRQVMLARPGEKINLVTREVEAQITPGNLADKKDIARGNLRLVGGGKTEIVDDRLERVHNIQLATQLVNGMVLAPGEEFSFNGIVGIPTEARGFQKAPVIDDSGEFSQSVGGGICQVSSTLYQAASAAGLEIVERHGHSQPVDYTPPGTDATVVPGEKDLRFCNSRERPLVILGSASTREVQFVLLEQVE
ncbi:MAG TPA: vanomycin resistance protein VanB [Firmicutes bacterium]|jgi:vancomycin resistance protein YoaR|nr:vanomycin resistance protein VanB [Bacillota bacterium]